MRILVLISAWMVVCIQENHAFFHLPSLHSAVKRHVPWLGDPKPRGDIGVQTSGQSVKRTTLPLVMSTWNFALNSTRLTYKYMTEDGLDLLDAVEKSISESCEEERCDNSVGPYFKVDEYGDQTLDALMMDGSTYEVGAVGNLRYIKTPIRVARAVMEYTTHTLLTGDQATEFAEMMGFPRVTTRTNETDASWQRWLDNDCQPNARQNVVPDPSTSCGPYTPVLTKDRPKKKHSFNLKNGEERSLKKTPIELDHDTICQIAMDGSPARVVVGTSTNGVDYKVPGRVGDSPIPGAGAFADSEVGAAIATGNGDIMMRSLPSYHAVEEMRHGADPQEATRRAMERLIRFFPSFSGALLAANTDGDYGAACVGSQSITYVIRGSDMEDARVETVNCEDSMKPTYSGTDQLKPLAVLLCLSTSLLKLLC